MEHKVCIRECYRYDPGLVYNAIKKSLDDIGFSIKKGSDVLIKPNILSSETPDKAVTTHPLILDAVCKILKEHNCRISIGESRGFYREYSTEEAFKVSGLMSIAEKYNAKIVIFEKDKIRDVRNKNAFAADHLMITGHAFSHDLFINLPKLKTHSFMKFTGGVKNLFGCVPGAVKQNYHLKWKTPKEFADVLLDIHEAIKPELTIMDGIIGLEGEGPGASGTPKKTGVILSSTNTHALDIVASRLIGFDPKEVPTIEEAVNKKLINIDNIRIIGNLRVVEYKKPFTAMPALAGKIVFNSVYVFPEFIHDNCEKCGICKEVCPANAISLTPYPVLDRKKCIRCYCCHEMCPHKAIVLKRSLIINILSRIRKALLGSSSKKVKGGGRSWDQR